MKHVLKVSKAYVEVPEVWHPVTTTNALSVGLFHITHTTHATATLI